ncbi:cytochrome P450 [Suillus brevipes Sb2]|nr:cytochrome P450 [Suillus brevipes Sb2]
MSSGIFVLFVAAAATAFFYSRRCSRLPLPPGPRPRFFTGNVHQLPKKELVWTYATWAERYGPIFSFRVPSRQFIVLSSLKSATDLLDSRATTYSDRPKLWMVELAKQNLNVFNISFTHPYFKTYRTVLKNSLSSRTIQTYQSLQTEQSRVLIDSLHKDPNHFAGHITRNTAAVILYLTYGWKVIESSDYWIDSLEEALEYSAIISKPGRWLVEVMPLLRFLPSWFPGAGFKRVAFDIAKKLSRFEGTPFNWTKQQIQSGNYPHSFVSEQLLPGDGSTVSAQQEDIIAWCSQGTYGAGVDTTASSLTSFILAMMLYPEVQKRAQAEIDAVVGRDQFPAFEDREKLPYIGALIQELLRWAPVAPAGVPHHAMREDVYKGYRIPKGSIVISNILSISRDKEMYPDPLEFRPERFLGPSPQTDPRKFVFGFGGRRCPGLHFAEALLYLNISCILAAFTIVKQLDEMGEEITPPVEFENVGPLWHPKPFKCRFIPRNKDLLATVSQ